MLTAAVVFLTVVTGCQPKADSQAPLAERVAKYWALKQSKGWDEVYDGFVDPTAKKTLSKEAFLKTRRLAFDILSYKLGAVSDEGDTAKVAVENEVNFPIRTPAGEMQLIKKQVTTTETWVRRDGSWFVQLEK